MRKRRAKAQGAADAGGPHKPAPPGSTPGPATTPEAPRELTPKQRRFVTEYLVDLNATQAAIRAGYSSRTARQQASDLLSKPDIAQALREASRARQKRVELTADYVLGNLAEVVERCMQRAPVMVREGREVVQLIDEEDRHVWQFDSKGANTALGLLGKHLRLFTDVLEAKVEGLSDEQRLERVKALVLAAQERKPK